MKAPSPAVRFYVKDWLTDTAHMSLEEQGAYMRLLCHQWAEGSLSADPAVLARLVSVTPRKWQSIWTAIGRHFTADGGSLRNPRLEEERDKQIAYHTRHSEQARGAAIEKWRRAKGIAGSIAPSTPESNAGAKLR